MDSCKHRHHLFTLASPTHSSTLMVLGFKSKLVAVNLVAILGLEIPSHWSVLPKTSNTCCVYRDMSSTPASGEIKNIDILAPSTQKLDERE